MGTYVLRVNLNDTRVMSSFCIAPPRLHEHFWDERNEDIGVFLEIINYITGFAIYNYQFDKKHKQNHEFARVPPSMLKTLPVIHEASSLARKRARSAISSGFPSRFISVFFAALETALAGSGKADADS